MTTLVKQIYMNDIPTSRECRKCLERKPLTEFYFLLRGRYKTTATCKECRKQYQKNFYKLKKGQSDDV